MQGNCNSTCEGSSQLDFLLIKMMPPDVISHENQLQQLSQPSIFILDVFRTADHAGQIFIPHRQSGTYFLSTGIYFFYKKHCFVLSVSWFWGGGEIDLGPNDHGIKESACNLYGSNTFRTPGLVGFYTSY